MCYSKGDDVEVVISYLDDDTQKIVRKSEHYNGAVMMIQLHIAGNEVLTILTEDAVVEGGLTLGEPSYR